MRLLDKNQLYVNLSEIEDKDFGISDGIKVLNQTFYGKWVFNLLESFNFESYK